MIVYSIAMNVSPAEERMIRDVRRMLQRKELGKLTVEARAGKITNYETTFSGNVEQLNEQLAAIPRPTGAVNGYTDRKD